MTNSKVSIENPCPVRLSRMSKTQNGHFCTSCATEVFDFTHASDEEIKASLANGVKCGLFTTDQLSKESIVKKGFPYQLMFKTLILLSFLGFTVKPLKAQGYVLDHKSSTIQTKELAKSKTKANVVYLKDRKKYQKKLRKRTRMLRKKRVKGRVKIGRFL